MKLREKTPSVEYIFCIAKPSKPTDALRLQKNGADIPVYRP